jgi:hypothetical protein
MPLVKLLVKVGLLVAVEAVGLLNRLFEEIKNGQTGRRTGFVQARTSAAFVSGWPRVIRPPRPEEITDVLAGFGIESSGRPVR